MDVTPFDEDLVAREPALYVKTALTLLVSNEKMERTMNKFKESEKKSAAYANLNHKRRLERIWKSSIKLVLTEIEPPYERH